MNARARRAPGPLPSAYAGWAAALVLALIGLSILLGNLPLLAVSVPVFFGLLLSIAMQPASGIEVSRRIVRTSVSIGEKVEVAWQLSIRGGFGPVVVFDRLPADLGLAEGSNVRVYWKWLKPAAYENRYVILCSKRGAYELPPTTWEVRHPFDLHPGIEDSSRGAVTLNVFPRLLAVRRVRTYGGIASSVEPSGARAIAGVVTTDFKEIREYTPGDPIKSINWKATARISAASRARPLVNEYQREGRRAVWLFVDCSTYMTVGSNLVNPLEAAIEAANALGHYFLTHGYYVGAHFSGAADEFLYPDVGRRHYNALSRRLTALRPAGDFYDLLRATHLTRQHLLALTPVCILVTRLDVQTGVDAGGPELHPRIMAGIDTLGNMSPSRIRRMPVWVVGINGYHYVADQVPGAGFGASIRHLETRPVVRELRRRSVSVLEWESGREPFAAALLRFTRGVKAR